MCCLALSLTACQSVEKISTYTFLIRGIIMELILKDFR
jgi:hypothetical protein